MKFAVLLFCSFAIFEVGQGQGSTTPLKVYKKRESGGSVYFFELTTYYASPSGSELVNGGNKEDGELTYVNVFRTSFKNSKKWYICRCSYYDPDVDADFVTSSANGCYDLPTSSTKGGSDPDSCRETDWFYASTKPMGNNMQVYVSSCERNGITYSRLTQTGGCPRNERRIHQENLFVEKPEGIACPSPAQVENGNIVTGRMGRDRVFPTTITLNCNGGYTIKDESESRCRDGQWSPSVSSLQCERVTCGTPRTPQNGYVKGRNYYYEDTVEYSCKTGYELDDTYIYSNTRSCGLEGKWVPHQEPECNPKKCLYPTDIRYGSLSLSEAEPVYGSVATYTCDTAYRLEGDAEITCQEDKTWSGTPPTCLRITCDPLSQPYHGTHNAENSNSGSVALFSCHEGYKLIGADLLRCLINEDGVSASWDNQPPVCQAIICEPPQVNSNVQILGNDYSFGKTIQFRCKDGFNIEGASSSTCRANGWDTSPPSCSAKMCRDPGVPDNGRRDGDSFSVYSTVTFHCNTGHQLNPPTSTIFCETTTRWSAQTPTCDPIKCPVLPSLQYGRLSNELFQYGQNLTFECFPGYELKGNPILACESNGQWNGQMPQCVACPKNHYKPGVNQDTCKQCPARSLTLSTATTSIDHCMCEEGSSKQDDGSCKAIRCAPLEAPENGNMTECEPSSGSSCYFSCQPGYTLLGSRDRRCTQNGWTGTQPVCNACPANTYKAGTESQTCIPCPVNSHTTGIGTSLESCLCKPGYSRGSLGVGACLDVNECTDNNGGCSQACSNTEGSYYCRCTIPGYTLLQDGKTCVMSESCTELKQLPAHGNVTCVHNPEENGRMCHFRCTQGYFFVSGINSYVTCGPDTGFKWSHQLVNETAQLPGCTKEFFVDTLLPVSFRYTSSSACDDINGKIDKIKKAIQEAVKDLDVCKEGPNRCGFENVVVQCNENKGAATVSVNFDIMLINFNKNAIGTDCDSGCVTENMRAILAKTLELKNQVEALIKSTDTKLVPGGTDIAVDGASFLYNRPKLLCDEGKVLTRKRLCVPCYPGFYLPRRDLETCLPCPVGQYQDQLGQTSCKPCLPGVTTAQEGSNHPVMCSVRMTEYTIDGNHARKRRSLTNDDPPLSKEEIDEILSVLD